MMFPLKVVRSGTEWKTIRYNGNKVLGSQMLKTAVRLVGSMLSTSNFFQKKSSLSIYLIPSLIPMHSWHYFFCSQDVLVSTFCKSWYFWYKTLLLNHWMKQILRDHSFAGILLQFSFIVTNRNVTRFRTLSHKRKGNKSKWYNLRHSKRRT